jgi:hypothetical protein
MMCVRNWWPRPQLWLHTLQGVFTTTSQSTGHFCLLHNASLLITPHEAPPNSAATICLRVRVRLPPPHFLLQSPHASQTDD